MPCETNDLKAHSERKTHQSERDELRQELGGRGGGGDRCPGFNHVENALIVTLRLSARTCAWVGWGVHKPRTVANQPMSYGRSQRGCQGAGWRACHMVAQILARFSDEITAKAEMTDRPAKAGREEVVSTKND